MTSFVPSSSGIITIPVLNVNFLYLQGVPVGDLSGQFLYLQGEIDALENQVNSLTATVNRIDLTGLTGNLVITDNNKNSVLLTAIQQLQGQVGNINQFDLTALAPYPPSHITITPTTTNQALDAKITTNTNNITTINGQITTLQNQVTSINNSITAINAKIAHISTWTVAGGTVMTGIRDNTGFAVDLSADDSSNGLFVYPNGDAHNAQVRIETDQTKQLYMRGGSAVTLYGGANGSNTSRNAIFIGDQSDNIKIGSFSGAITYPLVEIGCSGVGLADSTTRLKGDVYLTKGTELSPVYTQVVTADGDAGFVGRLDTQSRLSLSGLAVTTTATNPIIPITNLFGAITLTTGAGLISLVAGVGGINITAGGGAVAISTGGGAMSINCGAGVLNMASGTGASNWTTANGDLYLGAGKGTGGTAGGITMASVGNIVIQPDASLNIYHTDFIEMNTYGTTPATITRRIYDISGNLYYNGVMLSNDPSGNYVLISGSTMTGTLVTPHLTTSLIDSSGNLLIDPSGGTAGYNKTSYVEFVDTPPVVTTNRLYQQSNKLYFDGLPISDASGVYVPLAGGTMTGTLVTPQVTTPAIASAGNVAVSPAVGFEGQYNKTGYIEFNDASGSPVITTNRLYQQANQLYFDGTALGGGGVGFLPLSGGTLTGALISNYDAGQSTPQLQLTNTNNSAPIGGQGATIALRNDSAGNGAVGDRCGQMTFLAKDSVGTGARNFASIQGFVNDPTSTSIDGRLSTFVANNNTSTEIMRLLSETGTNARRCNIATNYMEIGSGSIASTATSTLTVAGSGTANITASLQTPLIYNALNIYPATSSTLVDNAVRKYQPERLYKLLTYPEPLSAPTIDGEKVYFVNPTGVPSSAMDSFVKYTNFGNQGGGSATWEYIQKCCFYKGSSVSGGVDAYYFACKYSDGNSYVFCWLDIDGTAWKMYPVGKATGEINDMCVGSPAYASGGTFHRVYVCGSFASMANSASPSTLITVNNVGQFGVIVSATSGFVSSSAIPMLSANDPAIAHETAFDNIAGVNGSLNCIVNASGLGTYGVATNQDIIVIGGQFYGVGAGGTTPPRNLASIAWYNPEYTSGLQTDQIGWSTLNNNSIAGSVVTGVGTETAQQRVIGLQYFNSGYGLMVYTGTTFNNETATPTTSNYMVYFYHSSGTVAFNLPNSDDQLLEVGQTFPNESSGYNYNNVVKGGLGASPSGAYGDFTYNTLCITNGLTPSGGQGFGVSWRRTSMDAYEYAQALVIDELTITPARQPQLESTPRNITGFYCNQGVYPDRYFVGTWNPTASIYEGFYTNSPYNVYNALVYNSAYAPVRGFASYSTILGYTGLNCWGQSTGDLTCNWFYKTSAIGDLTVELSGCLVRTDPNIYAKDTITFLGNDDGSSLCLIGDTNTSTNPFGLPSWWAFSQNGSVSYDDTIVNRDGSGGVQSITSGTAISAVNTGGGIYQINNTGVTNITAGTNVTISSTGASGTGVVTINASSISSNGWLKMKCPLLSINNTIGNNVTFLATAPSLNYLDTFKTGLGNNFDVGGGGSQLRYTGSGWVMVTITFTVGLDIYSSLSSNWINLITYSGGTYALSNFGLRIYVNDATGNVTQYNPDVYNWFLGSSNSYSNVNGAITSDPSLYENTVTYSCLLTTNSWIYVDYMCNQYFNQSGGGHSAGDLSATFVKSNWVLQIHETTAPDHT